MMLTFFRRLPLAACCGLLCLASALRAESPIQPGARVAVIGDSITEQKQYSKFIECYLLACSGVPDVKVFQYGWSGETASGFAARALNDLAGFHPTIATLCYGMNDGGYQPYRDEIGQSYEKNMRNVLQKLDEAGVKSIVVGSPGAVDASFFRPGQKLGDKPAQEAYNDNLAHLRDIDRKLAEEKKQSFADVHKAMADAMKPAQETLGKQYDVCGKDGFHPGPNGHLLMAYAFLKGLGLDGEVGTVTIDLNGQSTASTGHRVLGGNTGSVELESTRWPFCFEGDEKSSGGTRSILPFTPFNQDLNRFTLVVKNLNAPKGKVTWAGTSKEFTAEQLAAGVNLAAEFNGTPFDAPFRKLQDAVAKKQNFETYMIKQIITNFRSMPAELKDDPEIVKAYATIAVRLGERQKSLDADARATLVPVKHTIAVEAIK